MVEPKRPSDIVEHAFEELRQSHVPEGPSLHALEQTLQAVRQAQEESKRISIMERIWNMNKFIKYPVAAALALAMVIAAGYLLLGPRAESAFAELQEQIEQAKTMTMTAFARMKVMNQSMTVRMKFYCKSTGLMRQEMTLEGVGPVTSPSTPTSQPDKGVNIMIFDYPRGKGVSLIPSQKMAITMDFKNIPPEALAKFKEQDPLAQFKTALAGKHEELGKKTVEGQTLVGYRCKAGSLVMDIWTDPKSGTPVLVEQQLPDGMGTLTMTNFVLNPPLDDSLFDINVPPGYKVQHQTLDFNSTEKDLIRNVGLLAKLCGGVFPKSISPTPELIQQLQKADISQADDKKLGECVAQLMAFRVQTLQGGGEFVYAGDGVKLGDKATPILWYKAKDAKTYRVIYGDLHVEDAAKAPTQPAGKPTTKPTLSTKP